MSWKEEKSDNIVVCQTNKKCSRYIRLLFSVCNTDIINAQGGQTQENF